MRTKEKMGNDRQDYSYGFEISPRQRGRVFHASGRIKGYPFLYSVLAVPARESEEIQEATLANSQVVAEILRLEKRVRHRNAVYALYNQPPNFTIKITAEYSSGKVVVLLHQPLALRVPYYSNPELLKQICRGLLFLMRDLDKTFRNCLLYGTAETKQFWLLAIATLFLSKTTKDEDKPPSTDRRRFKI